MAARLGTGYLKFSSVRKSVNTELESGSRGTYIVGAVTRKLLGTD
jgi:hypothetical protein